MSAALSVTQGSMTGVTYEEANYRAGQCLALADLDVDDKDLCRELNFHAGYMRGLMMAGEPVNSVTFRLAYLDLMDRRERALHARVRTDVHIR